MSNLRDYTRAVWYEKAISAMTTPDPRKTVPPLPFLLATWFGCGLSPRAPGTVGTLGAIPFGILILWMGGIEMLLLATAIIFVLGLWAAREYERHTGAHDPGAIVIDEVAGMWVAMAVAGLNPLMIALAFVLFRVFDIKKPWPVSWADQKLPGAWGVMTDDIIAGVYAGALLGLVHIVVALYSH